MGGGWHLVATTALARGPLPSNAARRVAAPAGGKLHSVMVGGVGVVAVAAVEGGSGNGSASGNCGSGSSSLCQ